MKLYCERWKLMGGKSVLSKPIGNMYMVQDETGYVSYRRKQSFEESYRLVSDAEMSLYPMENE